MQLKSLYLYQCRRLRQNNIKVFEWDIKQPLNIIVGSNGSGKSTIVAMCNPNNPHKSQFEKGGSRKLVWANDTKEIIIENHFDSSVRHSFTLNGVVLNDRGTSGVQTQLILEHMGYTNNMHAILSGQKKFSKMSPTERKDLLMAITDVDFNEAQRVFDELKTKARDIAGAIKHADSRVANFKGRVQDKDQIAGMQQQAKKLEERINELLPLSNPSHTPVTKLMELEDRHRDLLEGLSNEGMESLQSFRSKLAKMKDIYSELESGVTPPMWDSVLSGVDRNIVSTESMISVLEDQLLTYESLAFSALNGNTNVSIDGVKEDMEIIKSKVDKYVALSEEKTEVYDVDINHTSLDEIRALYKEMVYTYPSGDMTTFTAQEIAHIEDSLLMITTKHGNLKHDIMLKTTVRDRADALLGTELVCGECSYVTFSEDGRSAEDITRLSSELTELGIVLDKTEITLGELSEKKREIEIYKGKVTLFRGIQKKYSSVGNIWRMLEESDMKYIMDSMDNVILSIRKIGTTIKHRLDYDSALKELKTLEDMHTALTRYESSGIAEKSANLQDELSELRESIASLTKKRKRIEQLVVLRDRVMEISTECNIGKDKLNQLTHERGEAQAYEVIGNELSGAYSQLASVNAALTSNAAVLDNLSGLEEDAAKLRVGKKATDALVKGMSPKHGIIGKQIRMTIDRFIDDVNLVIEEFWEDQLELIGVDPDKSLDYKFPMWIDGGEGEISEMSEGQHDAVDFAVTLVIMVYSGISDFPLYLDELGNKFDDVHRSKLIEFIKTLVQSGRASQAFMINHFSSEYGALPYADVIVTSANNLTSALPAEYNKSIRIA